MAVENVHVIRRLFIFYGLSLYCINATKGGTMFAKFELKYDAGEARLRGILKGTFHLVENTTSPFLHLIFSLSQAALLVKRSKAKNQGRSEREEITSREKRNTQEQRDNCTRKKS